MPAWDPFGLEPNHFQLPLTSGTPVAGGSPVFTTPRSKWWHAYGYALVQIVSPVAGSWNLSLYLGPRVDLGRCVLFATAQLGAGGSSTGLVPVKFAIPPATPLTPFLLDFYGASSWTIALNILETDRPLISWG